MRFTADYANDLLRKLEITYQAEGHSIDYIYSDPQFIDACKQEFESKRLEIERINRNIIRYDVQYRNRDTEVVNLRGCRDLVDEKVYRRLMDNAVGRRRKTLERHARTKASLVGIWDRIKELEVLRYAQTSGLRRFWDHPKYKIEKLSEPDFYELTWLIDVFFTPVKRGLAA